MLNSTPTFRKAKIEVHNVRFLAILFDSIFFLNKKTFTQKMCKSLLNYNFLISENASLKSHLISLVQMATGGALDYQHLILSLHKVPIICFKMSAICFRSRVL